MKHIGEYKGYQVFRNSDGFLEGYKTIGEKSNPTSNPNAESERVVTSTTTITDFQTFIDGPKKKHKRRVKQPKLFDDTTL